jgi:hypothetical protein
MVKLVKSHLNENFLQPSTLTPRERVRLALRSQEPDRVPIDLDGWATYFTEGAYRTLIQHLGINEGLPWLRLQSMIWKPIPGPIRTTPDATGDWRK